ncbi:hypothetical protein WJ972_20120 [Achromobacter insuavis]
MSRLSPDPSKLDPDTAALYQQLLKDYGPYANMLGAFLRGRRRSGICSRISSRPRRMA